MQRLEELNNKIIVEQIYEPENKNVIWKDPVNNVFKECVNGEWVKSENIAPAGGGGEFPYEYVTVNFNINIKAEDWIYDDEEYSIDINLLPEQIQIIENVQFVNGKINNQKQTSASSNQLAFNINEGHTIHELELDFSSGYLQKILGRVYYSTPKDINLDMELLFIGNKKSNQ